MKRGLRRAAAALGVAILVLSGAGAAPPLAVAKTPVSPVGLYRMYFVSAGSPPSMPSLLSIVSVPFAPNNSFVISNKQGGTTGGTWSEDGHVITLQVPGGPKYEARQVGKNLEDGTVPGFLDTFWCDHRLSSPTMKTKNCLLHQ